MIDEINKWKEAVALTLAAILGFVFRLGRKEQRQEDRIVTLESWAKRRDEEAAQFREDFLSHIKVQEAEVAAIREQVKSTGAQVREIKEDLRLLMATRMYGGCRWYDEKQKEEYQHES